MYYTHILYAIMSFFFQLLINIAVILLSFRYCSLIAVTLAKLLQYVSRQGSAVFIFKGGHTNNNHFGLKAEIVLWSVKQQGRIVWDAHVVGSYEHSNELGVPV